MSNLTGQSLGRYHILEQLGEGGMATVYKAYDTRLETDVAVKVIRTEVLPQNAVERTLKRFEREAKSLARLTHPNIVKVMDYGEHDGAPYLVLVYLPGGTLKERMKGKPMSWQEAVRLLVPIANALDYAHEQKIIHRDVKPANILLTVKGQPMLSDFGIAKILEMEEGHTLTGTGMGVGTPEYMAPEQGMGRDVDGRADIYSLGIIFYELITGRKPYTADTPMAVILKHMTDPLPRPRQYATNLPDAVERVLLKALAKDPKDRYADAGAFAAAMENLIGGSQSQSISSEQPARGRDDSSETMDTFATNLQAAPESSGTRPKMPLRLKKETITTTNQSQKRRTSTLWIVLGVVGIVLASVLIDRLIRGVGTAEVSPTNSPSFTITPFTTQTPSTTNTPLATNTPLVTVTPALGIGSTMTGKDGMVLLYVPAGEFTMGSDNGQADEKPAHTVYLDSYYIDKYEVTNALYKTCVDAGLCATPQQIKSYKRPMYYGNPEFGDYPVIYVDWNQAVNYCEWRGGSLPTEAQWEKAARGTDGRTYPWGEGIDCNKVNYNVLCTTDTSKVGSYADGKSPYGIFDMAGNVWEWVMDWYDSKYYSTSPSLNPQGPDSGKNKVLRGGSWVFDGSFTPAGNQGGAWYNYIGDLRSSDRGRGILSAVDMSIGFRCARSLP